MYEEAFQLDGIGKTRNHHSLTPSSLPLELNFDLNMNLKSWNLNLWRNLCSISQVKKSLNHKIISLRLESFSFFFQVVPLIHRTNVLTHVSLFFVRRLELNIKIYFKSFSPRSAKRFGKCPFSMLGFVLRYGRTGECHDPVPRVNFIGNVDNLLKAQLPVKFSESRKSSKCSINNQHKFNCLFSTSHCIVMVESFT